MQPYPYAIYPNGAPMPMHYLPPDSYGRPAHRPSKAIPRGHPLRHPAPSYPPPQRRMMPVQYQHQPQYVQQYPPRHPSQMYYPNYYGSYPTVPPVPKATKGNAVKNKGLRELIADNDINALLDRKGTRVKVKKIYRITKHKPGIQGDDTSDDDDEYEQIPLDSPRPRTIRPPPRIPTAASSCSHCSTCSNCSCSECLHQNRSHVYDGCPQCRAERQMEQFRGQRRR